MQCALRLPGSATRCGACLRRGPDAPVRRTSAAVDYGFPWDGLVTGFKFHGRLDLVGALASLLDRRLPAHEAGTTPDLVLPIPLSEQRLRERGYNQAWELARRLARWRRLDADARLLLRIRDTAHQLGLSEAERAANLKGAFLVEPRRRQQLQGRRVALVDDVMTSGATLEEAARCLLAAGATQVHAWVVARTPAPG